MVCEKCGQEMDTVKCQRCGEALLRLGPFCYKCGAELETSTREVKEDSEESDFSKRVLCSDGACIGVINEEGICKVCGKPYTPDA
jgi:predicted amidophosphoribosyltransferase